MFSEHRVRSKSSFINARKYLPQGRYFLFEGPFLNKKEIDLEHLDTEKRDSLIWTRSIYFQVDDCNLLKMWIQLLIPKVEDGNNFGVGIQVRVRLLRI